MLVIHIGMKKAGSASIQSFLTSNADSLKLSSIDYPAAGRIGKKDHHNLFSEIMERPVFYPFVGTLDDFSKHLIDNHYDTTIMSSEMFEGSSPEAIGKLKEKLTATGQEFRIVMVIRDLVNLMPSSYAQKVRFGRDTYNFDEFFEKRINEARVHSSETARLWAREFGWNSMRIIDLHAARPDGTDLIDDFLAACDAPRGPGSVFHLPRPGIVNAASGWRVLEAVRALHRGEHGLPDDHRLLTYMTGRSGIFNQKRIEKGAVEVGDALGWNRDRGNYMTRLQAQTCLDIHRESIAALNACLPAPLAMPPDLETREFVERDFLPEAARIPASELRSFYDQVGKILKPGGGSRRSKS
jgi:hypothetical protein